jgi:hypothetical protein
VCHLFVADDSFLFFRATIDESENFKQFLFAYELASDQKVNFDKSSLLFSTNVPSNIQQQISFNLGVRNCQDHGKYLGRNKSLVFDYVKDKVRRRISGWRKKLLSRSGKEVLIKSITQAIPSYVITVF